MELKIKFRDNEARSIEHFLQIYFKSKAKLPTLAKVAIRVISAKGATEDLKRLERENAKCEIRWCESDDARMVRANEDISDGCYSVQICQTCAKALNISEDGHLPDASEVQAKLKKFYKKESSK